MLRGEGRRERGRRKPGGAAPLLQLYFLPPPVPGGAGNAWPEARLPAGGAAGCGHSRLPGVCLWCLPRRAGAIATRAGAAAPHTPAAPPAWPAPVLLCRRFNSLPPGRCFCKSGRVGLRAQRRRQRGASPPGGAAVAAGGGGSSPAGRVWARRSLPWYRPCQPSA